MYCIYRIRNKVNGKTYIGQHRYKKLNDSYMGLGVHLPKEIRDKISKSIKARNARLTSEERKKIYGRKFTDEVRRKMSEAKKERHWYNNGVTSVTAFECPEGFVKGRL